MTYYFSSCQRGDIELMYHLASSFACAGFAAVLELMRDSRKPAVGHNLSFDLAYSLHSFADHLPPNWEEYKAMASHTFLSNTCSHS